MAAGGSVKPKVVLKWHPKRQVNQWQGGQNEPRAGERKRERERENIICSSNRKHIIPDLRRKIAQRASHGGQHRRWERWPRSWGVWWWVSEREGVERGEGGRALSGEDRCLINRNWGAAAQLGEAWKQQTNSYEKRLIWDFLCVVYSMLYAPLQV